MIIHDVEQRTDAWFALRRGMPTSSTFFSLVTATGRIPKSLTPYATDLAGQIVNPNDTGSFTGNNATDRGTELEPEAIKYYEYMTGNTVTEVGFVTDDLLRYGTSTDGFIRKEGIAELKAFGTKNHINAVLHYDSTGEMLEERKPQVQGELMVTKFDWADLVYFHPEMRSIIIRVYPDLEYHALLKSQITRVLIERDRIVKVMRK